MGPDEDERAESDDDSRSTAFLAVAFAVLLVLGVVGFFVLLGLSGVGPAAN